MAKLHVKFGRVPARDNPPPVMVGSATRVEYLEIDASSAGASDTETSARKSENVVSLYAEAACWVAVGAQGAAAKYGASSHYIPAGGRLDLWISVGEFVSMAEDA